MSTNKLDSVRVNPSDVNARDMERVECEADGCDKTAQKDVTIDLRCIGITNISIGRYCLSCAREFESAIAASFTGDTDTRDRLRRAGERLLTFFEEAPRDTVDVITERWFDFKKARNEFATAVKVALSEYEEERDGAQERAADRAADEVARERDQCADEAKLEALRIAAKDVVDYMSRYQAMSVEVREKIDRLGALVRRYEKETSR